MPEQRGSLKIWLLAAVILVAAILTFQYLVSTKPEPPKPEQQKRATVVAVEEIKLQNLPPVLRLYGKVESVTDTILSSRINASVVELEVNEGDRVEKGNLLVQLEQSDARLAMQQSRSRVSEARANLTTELSRYETDKAALANERALARIASDELNRFRELQKEGLASQSQVDNARAALEQRLLAVSARELAVQQHAARKAQIEAQIASATAGQSDARLDIDRSRITAPFDGLVHRVEVAIGDSVNPGTRLVAMYDPSRLEVRAPIPSDSQARIQAALNSGTPPAAEILVGGAMLHGHLQRLSASTRESTGNLDAFIISDQKSELLRLGQTVTVILRLNLERDVAAVPFSALYGSNRVYLYEDGKMRGLTVQRVGEHLDSAGRTHVLIRGDGLNNGGQLIISQVAQALDGLSVTTAASGKDSE